LCWAACLIPAGDQHGRRVSRIDRELVPSDAVAALELVERMDFEAVRLDRSACLKFGLSAIGAGKVFRAVYEVPVSEREFGAYKLHEGRECKAFAPSNILLNPRVTPYDAFAVWLHYARKHFRLAVPDAAGRVPGIQ
jgi:hypothetical protein